MNAGERHARLVAIKYVRTDVTPSGQKKPVWQFKCDCGSVCDIRSYSVRSGKTKSCGCLHRETKSNLTHGEASGSHSPEYRSWRCMLTRARNPNIINADRYVLRGIGVCDEWQPGGDGKGFERFLAHVGRKPSAPMQEGFDL